MTNSKMNFILERFKLSFLVDRKSTGFNEMLVLEKIHLSSWLLFQSASTWTAFAKYSFYDSSKMPIRTALLTIMSLLKLLSFSGNGIP